MVAKRVTRVVDTLLKQHAVVVVFLHVCLIVSSLTIAWLLQFGFTPAPRTLLVIVAPILLLVRLAAVARFKLLHGNWSYTGIDDATEILKATTSGSLVFFV